MLWETMIQWAPVVLRRCFDAVWQVTLPWIHHHFAPDVAASFSPAAI